MWRYAFGFRNVGARADNSLVSAAAHVPRRVPGDAAQKHALRGNRLPEAVPAALAGRVHRDAARIRAAADIAVDAQAGGLRLDPAASGDAAHVGDHDRVVFPGRNVVEAVRRRGHGEGARVGGARQGALDASRDAADHADDDRAGLRAPVAAVTVVSS